ncbi:calcium-dependent protein kinase 27-like [Sorghum bicolor]|uniref:calcium-dependent protein kinase 27-like n=1 Tax=Sorghum bicolor TaxID=4558 RepID=UPI000B4253DF|nr:calcium-dependent protein kinase 27-like [Sorghum bicolor]|eukprot:XP_021318663.1 calcium-dependent protein kinase 27-like [Sorghum bicolor]
MGFAEKKKFAECGIRGHSSNTGPGNLAVATRPPVPLHAHPAAPSPPPQHVWPPPARPRSLASAHQWRPRPSPHSPSRPPEAGAPTPSRPPAWRRPWPRTTPSSGASCLGVWSKLPRRRWRRRRRRSSRRRRRQASGVRPREISPERIFYIFGWIILCAELIGESKSVGINATQECRKKLDRHRMEVMFQWMQNLGASMGQPPPPELLAPLPPPEGTPNQSAASNNMPH